MPTPVWFMLALLGLNLGAAIGFLKQGNEAWALIYAGASVIQLGCYWATK